MKFDRGMLFLAFTGLVLIVLVIALAATVVTSPPPSSTPDSDQDPLLGSTVSQPEPAIPAMKSSIYPGISTKYNMDGLPIGTVMGYLAGQSIYGKVLTLNDDGTIAITIDRCSQPITCGHWYKIKGNGHSIYLTFGGDTYSLYYYIKKVACTANIGNKNGKDYFNVINVEFTGDSYNDWDAGYSNMSLPVSMLGPYIDCCIPADTARPYVEKGFTGDQGVPYMLYNVPPETAVYFANLGITGDLCGPYYAAGVSREDTIEYLDEGITYDRARPYIDAKVPASIAAPFADSSFPADQCMPYIDANIDISKARPFLLFKIPADQAVIYINNGITASTAKPYVDAGVPAEKAVEDIKNGIPPMK